MSTEHERAASNGNGAGGDLQSALEAERNGHRPDAIPPCRCADPLDTRWPSPDDPHSTCWPCYAVEHGLDPNDEPEVLDPAIDEQLRQQPLADDPNYMAPYAPTADVEIVTLEEFVAVDEPGAAAIIGEPGEVLIAENSDVMIYGDGGARKTTLTVDLAFHLGSCVRWLGMPVPRRRRVLIIESEGPRPLFRDKLHRKLAPWGGLRSTVMCWCSRTRGASCRSRTSTGARGSPRTSSVATST